MRRSTVLAATAAVLLLAGCAVPGIGGNPTDPPTSSTEPEPSATMPTEIPSWLLECGHDSDERDETLQLTTLDLTAATWSMPSAYEAAHGYAEDNPVETLHSEWIAQPTDPPLPSLNVINVVIYTGVDWGGLEDGCGRVPLEAVEEKLAQYREQISASPTSEAEMTELAGLPAIAQDIGLSRYSYTGIWLFTETQLLHLYCQWTDPSYEATIRSGCEELAASVQVPGA